MPTFPLWDRAIRDVSRTETLTVDRAEVKSVNDLQVRDCNEIMRNCTNLVKTDDSEYLVGIPAGEVHDRLNDDYATAPDMSDGGLLSGLSQAASEPPADIAAYEGTDDPDPAEDTDG